MLLIRQDSGLLTSLWMKLLNNRRFVLWILILTTATCLHFIDEEIKIYSLIMIPVTKQVSDLEYILNVYFISLPNIIANNTNPLSILWKLIKNSNYFLNNTIRGLINTGISIS